MVQKTRKRRKPLTEEQKAERRERLAKARAAKPEPKHSSVHPDVPRDNDSIVNLTSVRRWIKTNKEKLASAKQSLKLNPKDKKINNEVNILDCYVQNLQAYLRTGVWLDLRYGEHMEGKITKIVHVPAYHWHPNDPYKGMIKREVGVIYPDIGIWSQEMHDEYYNHTEIEEKPVEKKKRRRKSKPK